MSFIFLFYLFIYLQMEQQILVGNVSDMINKFEQTTNEVEIKQTTNDIEDDRCSICLDDLKTSLSTLACGHIFHTKCLIDLVFECDNKDCPNCRRNIDVLPIFQKLPLYFYDKFKDDRLTDYLQLKKCIHCDKTEFALNDGYCEDHNDQNDLSVHQRTFIYMVLLNCTKTLSCRRRRYIGDIFVKTVKTFNIDDMEMFMNYLNITGFDPNMDDIANYYEYNGLTYPNELMEYFKQIMIQDGH